MKLSIAVFSVVVVLPAFSFSWGWVPRGTKRRVFPKATTEPSCFSLSPLPLLNRAAATALLGILIAATAVPPPAFADLSQEDILLIKGIKSDIHELRTSMENNFAAIDNKFDAIDNKFDAIDNKFDEMQSKFVLVPIVSTSISAIATIYSTNKLETAVEQILEKKESIKKEISIEGFKGSIAGILSVFLLMTFLYTSKPI